jgi:hypothetical protein
MSGRVIIDPKTFNEEARAQKEEVDNNDDDGDDDSDDSKNDDEKEEKKVQGMEGLHRVSFEYLC